jgi:pimeloyl-ACP methyl ester carboxylesterase
MAYDLLIKNGLIVDGSGMPSFHGDVGVKETQLLARALRSFALDSVPGAGHFIQEEQPGAVLTTLARLEASVTATRASGSL